MHVVVTEVRNHRVANHGTANEVSLPSVHAVPHRQTLHAATDLPVVAAAVAHSLHTGGQMRTNETETGAVVVPEESRYTQTKTVVSANSNSHSRSSVAVMYCSVRCACTVYLPKPNPHRP